MSDIFDGDPLRIIEFLTTWKAKPGSSKYVHTPTDSEHPEQEFPSPEKQWKSKSFFVAGQFSSTFFNCLLAEIQKSDSDIFIDL